MLKMIIKLDENRMMKDGLDVSEKWNEIDQTLSDIEEIQHPEKGIFVTNDSGARNWFMELLEEMLWFMKYVAVWKIDDGDLKDDVIEGLRDLGIRCSYE